MMRSMLDTAWGRFAGEGGFFELDCHKLARETGCTVERLHALGVIRYCDQYRLDLSRMSEATAILVGAATGGTP
jgi:hypothetical protein